MGYDIACYVDIINRWVWEIYTDDSVCRIEIWHIRTGVGYRFYLNCDDVNKFTKTILHEVGDYS